MGVVDSAPYAIKTPEDHWEGLIVELWQRVAQELGASYELHEYGRLEEVPDAVHKGKVDITAALAQAKKHEYRIDFSNAYSKSGCSIEVRRNINR